MPERPGHRHVDQRQIEVMLPYQGQHFVAVRRFRRHLDVRHGREDLPEPVAHELVIVSQEQADHAPVPSRRGFSGTHNVTRVPPRGARPTSSVPPA